MVIGRMTPPRFATDHRAAANRSACAPGTHAGQASKLNMPSSAALAARCSASAKSSPREQPSSAWPTWPGLSVLSFARVRSKKGLYAVQCGTQQSHFPGRERSDAPTGCLSLNIRTRAMAMKVDARERSIGGFSWRGKECIAWTTALWTCGHVDRLKCSLPTCPQGSTTGGRAHRGPAHQARTHTGERHSLPLFNGQERKWPMAAIGASSAAIQFYSLAS